MEREGILFCLVAPSGGGKTTIRRILLEQFSRLERSVSVTTRSCRAGEVDGESYHFVTQAEFQRRIDAGLFFEWEEVHGERYGTLRETLDNGIARGIDLVFDIDIRGALTLRQAFPKQTVTLFLVPPSREVLKDRVRKRATMTDRELETRLATATAEYERLEQAWRAGLGIDYLVINDVLSDCVEEVKSILRAERARLSRITESSFVSMRRLWRD